jgi:hypothetical protein
MENVPTIHISECWVTGGGLKNQVLWVTPPPHADPGTAIQINRGAHYGIALKLPVHWVKDTPMPDATSATSDAALNRSWDLY